MTHTPLRPDVRDRSLPLLVAAGGLVVAVVAAVVLFGVDRPPSLPRLADDPAPAPDAAVAVTTFRGQPCIDVAAPDGTLRQVRCDRDGGELIGWDADEGLLVADWSGASPRLLVIDPEFGEVIRAGGDVDQAVLEDRWQGSQDAVGRRDGEQLVVVGPSGDELWRVDAPAAYELHVSSRSPDGRWLAAVDSAERLLLFDLDEAATPRIWASGVDTYLPPVWEGSGHQADQGASGRR